METRDGLSEDEREALQKELKVVELEEARLVQELEEVEKNRERAAVALEAAQAETETREQQERQCHRDYSKLQSELQDELWIVEYVLSDPDSLAKICDDGPLAIISNFRLGCVPTVLFAGVRSMQAGGWQPCCWWPV